MRAERTPAVSRKQAAILGAGKWRNTGPGRQPGCSFCIPERAWTSASRTGPIGKPVTGGICRHGAVHQARETFCEFRVGKTQTTHGARAEGLHHDISVGTQPKKYFAALGCLQIDHCRSTTAIPYVIRRLPTEGITPGRFDLHDICSQIGQEHDADGAGNAPTQIEHPHSAQRSGGRAHVGVTRRSEAITIVSSMTVASATFGRKPNRKTEMLFPEEPGR